MIARVQKEENAIKETKLEIQKGGWIGKYREFVSTKTSRERFQKQPWSKQKMRMSISMQYSRQPEKETKQTLMAVKVSIYELNLVWGVRSN